MTTEQSSRFDELQALAAPYDVEIRVTIYPGGAAGRHGLTPYENVGLSLDAQLDTVEAYLHGRRHQREDHEEKLARHLQKLIEDFAPAVVVSDVEPAA